MKIIKSKVKWSKIKSGENRSYSRCYGAPFMIQISGSGLVAPCGMLFNEKYKRYHIGNITEKRFKDIWKSEEYWEVMNHLASVQFDAKTMCGTLCLQHKVNEALDNHVKGVKRLEQVNNKKDSTYEFYINVKISIKKNKNSKSYAEEYLNTLSKVSKRIDFDFINKLSKFIKRYYLSKKKYFCLR